MTPPPGNDALFRHALSIPLIVRQFLGAWLPPEFLNLVDWSTLRIEKIAGINTALSERREDLVYRVEAAGRPVCFYILLEHQSRADRLMPLRVMEYLTLIWQEHRKRFSKNDAGKLLPLIIPVVLYPGPGKWGTVRRLRDLIDIPEPLREWALRFAPDAGFCLVELAGLPLEKLADGAIARAILAALQKERLGAMDFEAVQTIVSEIFSDPQRAVAIEVSRHLWEYLLHHSELQSQEVNRIVELTVPIEQKPNFMSTAELLRKQGLEQGLEQGQLLALQSSVLEALEARFDQVPLGLAEAIRQVTEPEKLRALLRTSVRCLNLEAFIEAL